VRRIVSVLTLALVMAAMMSFAAPAFARSTGGLEIDPGATTEHIPECMDELLSTGQPGMHCMLLQSTPPVSPM
jgi:hypothetical protein